MIYLPNWIQSIMKSLTVQKKQDFINLIICIICYSLGKIIEQCLKYSTIFMCILFIFSSTTGPDSYELFSYICKEHKHFQSRKRL